jgi:hypothetical protein
MLLRPLRQRQWTWGTITAGGMTRAHVSRSFDGTPDSDVWRQ